MDGPKNYWFPSKKYGWGWGAPRVWQGWLVLLGYLVGMIAIFLQVSPSVEPSRFALYVFALSILLVMICWHKGEPPRWRWGGK